MSTQYNSIQEAYDYIRKVSIALIEKHNVHDCLRLFLTRPTSGAESIKVLELAAGSGFYTHSLSQWGATHITAVEVSQAMINASRSSIPFNNPAVIKYIQADCSAAMEYEGGPYDICFAAWLLNYAPDRAGLIDMFRNISLNLKPNGVFVGVTVPPDDDPVASINAECKARPREEGGSGLLFYEVLKDLDNGDGVEFRAWGDTPVGGFSFDCYHLKKSVYEQCAREGGMKGDLNWVVTSVPQEYLDGKGEGGSSLKEIRSYVDVPNYGILVVKKE